MSAGVRAPFTGVVLAGGESRRMGTDKALLESRGMPLWQRQLNVLRESGADPVWIARRADQGRLGDGSVVHVHDRVVNAGPMAGLEAALEAATTLWIAVLAVDMPAIDAGWFRWLNEFCGRDVGAVAQGAGGEEPLAAFYPRAARAIVTERLERGERSMRALVRALADGGHVRMVRVPVEWESRLANWNSPSDCRSS